MSRLSPSDIIAIEREAKEWTQSNQAGIALSAQKWPLAYVGSVNHLSSYVPQDLIHIGVETKGATREIGRDSPGSSLKGLHKGRLLRKKRGEDNTIHISGKEIRDDKRRRLIEPFAEAGYCNEMEISLRGRIFSLLDVSLLGEKEWRVLGELAHSIDEECDQKYVEEREVFVVYVEKKGETVRDGAFLTAEEANERRMRWGQQDVPSALEKEVHLLGGNAMHVAREMLIAPKSIVAMDLARSLPSVRGIWWSDQQEGILFSEELCNAIIKITKKYETQNKSVDAVSENSKEAERKREEEKVSLALIANVEKKW